MTAPVSGFYDLNLAAGQNFTGENFGDRTPFTPGSIQGVVFNDANLNGTQDSGEVPLANRFVFLDTNKDGIWQASEPIVITDANGHYNFPGLVAGSYTVSTYLPPGTQQTTNAGKGIAISLAAGQNQVLNIGEAAKLGAISGTIFKDVNGNGIQDNGETGISGVTVYLDQNGNGKLDTGELKTLTNSSGFYSFTNLPAGNYKVTEILSTGFVSTPAGGFINVTLAPGQLLGGVNFGDRAVANASISGHVLDDVNGNGSKEVPLGGWTVYLDLKHTGNLDPGDPTTVTDTNGAYAFTGLAAGSYRVREQVPQQPGSTSLVPVVPAGGYYDVSVTTGLAVSGKDFINRVPTGTPGAISGFVFGDTNGNGKLDTTEIGLPGVFVYIDSNNSGTWQPGEPATFTDGSGHYLFPNVPVGTYQVRVQLPTGESQTTPIASGKVTIASGQNKTVDIGVLGGTGTITGTVFTDNKDDAKFDAGDTPIAGQQVYLDLNGDGVWQNTEPSTISAANGTFSFTHLPAGTYAVREIVASEPVAGDYYLTNSYQFYNPNVTLGSGATATVNFSNRKSIGTLNNVAFNFTLTASALQLDGKLVAVGYTGLPSAGTAKSVVARYNPDGTPDLTFGVGGEVVTFIGNHQSQANDVVVGIDGRIVVVGDSDMNYGLSGGSQVAIPGGSAGYIRRYFLNGVADASLSYITPLPGFVAGSTPQYGYLQHFNRVYILPDGHVLAFGAVRRYNASGKLPLTDYSRVYRFLATGASDSTFGNGGWEQLPIINSGDILTSNVAFGADGSFYVPGFTQPAGGSSQFEVLEFNPAGTLIGYPQVNFSGRNSFATAADVQNDGNVVLAGYGLVGANASTGQFEITRLTVSGSPDPTFGGGAGQVSIVLGSGGDVADDVQVQPDGSILVTGHSTVGSNTAPVAVRLNADGSLDTTFGVGGKFVGAYVATSSYKNGDLRFLISRGALVKPPAPAPAPASVPGQLSVSNGAVHPGLYNTGSDQGGQPGQGKGTKLGGAGVPTASLYYGPPITNGGFGYSFFQVYYHDKHKIDLGSLGNANIVITGPNGYRMNALCYGTFGGTTATDVYVFYAFYPPGGSWDSGDNGAYTLTLQSSQISNGHNYAVATTLGTINIQIKSSTISGFVFNDLNGDGIRQTNEPALLNRYVYIDLNNTGNYAYNDPIALSNSDGFFDFGGLAAGTYVVRTYLPPGWKQTTPPQRLTFTLYGNNNPSGITVGEKL